jgi:hypothetical protein
MNESIYNQHNKWIKSEFSIIPLQGEEKKVSGIVKGLFGIWKDGDGFTLTHLPSGLRATYSHSEYMMRALAHHINPLFPSNGEMFLPPIGKEIGNIVRTFREKCIIKPKENEHYIGIQLEKTVYCDMVIKVTGVKDRKEAEKLAKERAIREERNFQPDRYDIIDDDSWSYSQISREDYNDEYTPDFEIDVLVK